MQIQPIISLMRPKGWISWIRRNGLFWMLWGLCLGCAPTAAVNPDGSPEKPASTGQHIFHTVGPGETLSTIAVHYYGTYKRHPTVDILVDYNTLKDPRAIHTGQRIKIPILMIDGTRKPDMSGQKAASPPAVSPPPPPPPGVTSSASPLVQEGISRLNEGRYPEAVAIFEKAVRAQPRDETARRYLITAQFQQAIGEYEAEKYPEARDRFQKVLALKPDCGECDVYLERIRKEGEKAYRLGISLFESGQFQKAADAFERSRRLVPDTPDLGLHLFKAYFELAATRYEIFQQGGESSDHKAALEALGRASRLKKGCDACAAHEERHKQERYNSGIKFFTQKEGPGLEQAIRNWRQVHFIDPDYRDVKNNIQKAEELLKKLKEMG